MANYGRELDKKMFMPCRHRFWVSDNGVFHGYENISFGGDISLDDSFAFGLRPGQQRHGPV